MRLVGWNVQPVLMADDGDNLTPVSVTAYIVPASEWETFKSGGDAEALEALRRQIETPSGSVAPNGAGETQASSSEALSALSDP
jgi:hypothetical protein